MHFFQQGTPCSQSDASLFFSTWLQSLNASFPQNRQGSGTAEFRTASPLGAVRTRRGTAQDRTRCLSMINNSSSMLQLLTSDWTPDWLFITLTYHSVPPKPKFLCLHSFPPTGTPHPPHYQPLLVVEAAESRRPDAVVIHNIREYPHQFGRGAMNE